MSEKSGKKGWPASSPTEVQYPLGIFCLDSQGGTELPVPPWLLYRSLPEVVHTGRPLKSGIDYFRHDTDMSGDEAVEALETLHGNDGYAVFCKLLERIYRDGSCFCLSDDVKRLSVARRCNVSEEKFASIIKDAVRFGLFEEEPWREEKVLTSERIRRQIGQVARIRESGREFSASETEFPTRETGLSERIGTQSRAEHRKVEKRKAEQSEQRYAQAPEIPTAEKVQLKALMAANGIREEQDVERIGARLETLGLGIEYVQYCVERVRRQGARKPAGLLKKAILGYPEWVDEFRACRDLEKQHAIRQPEAPPTLEERQESAMTMRKVILNFRRKVAGGEVEEGKSA